MQLQPMRFSLGALQHLLRRVHSRLSPATWNLLVGVVMLLVISNIPLDPRNPKVARCAAITLVMSYFWMSAPIPIAVTAMLPLPLFPLLGISPAKSVAVSYFNDTMWVFIGSFIVALAVEKSSLHRRIALRSLTVVGTRPIMMLAAFMGVTACLSMVLTNTACTIMMVPIAGAMFEAFDKITGKSDAGLKKALYLGIAYASSTGGLMTLTGSSPRHSLVSPCPAHPALRHRPQPHYGGPAHHHVPQGTAHIIHAVVHVRWAYRLCHACVRVAVAVSVVGAPMGMQAAAAAAAAAAVG